MFPRKSEPPETMKAVSTTKLCLHARQDAFPGFLEDALRRDIMDGTGNVPKKRRNRLLCCGTEVIRSCFYAITVQLMSTP